MDFSWTEEQLSLKAEVVKFAQRELNNDLFDRGARQPFALSSDMTEQLKALSRKEGVPST